MRRIPTFAVLAAACIATLALAALANSASLAGELRHACVDPLHCAGTPRDERRADTPMRAEPAASAAAETSTCAPGMPCTEGL